MDGIIALSFGTANSNLKSILSELAYSTLVLFYIAG